MSDSNKTPQIVTYDTLLEFKNQLLNSIGITLGGKSIIQQSSKVLNKAVNSAFFGENHSIKSELLSNSANKGLKNVLVSGYGNIASSWNQTVLGTFNKQVDDTLLIVGNGTSDKDRNNILEVFKDGRFSLHNVTFTPVNTDKLAVDGRIAYSEGGLLENTYNWEAVKAHITELQEDELITADIAKIFCDKINNFVDFDHTEAGNWRDGLVQGLDYEGANLDKKALSVQAGQELKAELMRYRNDARITNIINMINLLRRQVSYLISCLSVDKVTNDKEGDERVEYYAVSLADYALDADTPFMITDCDCEEHNTKQSKEDKNGL